MTLSRQTLALGAAALVMTALALWAGLKENPASRAAAGAGEILVPGFAAQKDAVAKIVLSGPGNTVTLTRDGGIWRVGEKAGHPADGILAQLLVSGFADARKLEPRTADPAYLGRLGLGDGARQLNLENETGETLAAVTMGDQFMSPSGLGIVTFVWDQTEARAWTATGFPEISPDPAFWLDEDVLHLSQLRVKRVSVALAGTEPYAIGRPAPESANFAPLQSLGATYRQEAVNALGFALTDVFLEDATPAGGDDLFHVADAVYETFDGLTVTVSLFDREGIVWASFAAHHDPSVLDRPGTPAVLPDAPADGAAEAANLNALWRGKIFRLPLEQISAILKRRQDLVR